MDKGLRILIVEDETRGRSVLKAMLILISPNFIVEEAANVDDAVKIIERFNPDLVLLDIEMPYKNGFDLLAELPSLTFDVIFTTAYNSYAIRAIKFSAMDYLLKPIDAEELELAIDKTTQKRKLNENFANSQINNLLENLKIINKQKFKLSLPTFQGNLFISVDEIIRCESDANYTRFFLNNDNKSVLVSKTLKDYEDLLTEYGFCRVHNSFMINLKFIKKYIKGEGGIAVMVDGAEVEISRRRKEIFLKSIEKYTGLI
jgi:two-component system, LytTR family, response regulator